jgi:hypothetical protein
VCRSDGTESPEQSVDRILARVAELGYLDGR